jgi:hypothetical protein
MLNTAYLSLMHYREIRSMKLNHLTYQKLLKEGVRTFVVALLGMTVLFPFLPKTVSVLHPDMTYTVSGITNGYATCVSQPFYVWPVGRKVSVAKMNIEYLPQLQEGAKFKVTDTVWSDVPDTQFSVVVLKD